MSEVLQDVMEWKSDNDGIFAQSGACCQIWDTVAKAQGS